VNTSRSRRSYPRTPTVSDQSDKIQKDPPNLRHSEDSENDDVLEKQRGPVKMKNSSGSSHPSKSLKFHPNPGTGFYDSSRRVQVKTGRSSSSTHSEVQWVNLFSWMT
jgi:hypothetical protein